jgi:hypothetical protein
MIPGHENQKIRWQTHPCIPTKQESGSHFQLHIARGEESALHADAMRCVAVYPYDELVLAVMSIGAGGAIRWGRWQRRVGGSRLREGLLLAEEC